VALLALALLVLLAGWGLMAQREHGPPEPLLAEIEQLKARGRADATAQADLERKTREQASEIEKIKVQLDAERARIAALPPPSDPRGTVAAAAPPGTVFRDCPECPEMVVVPAGRFTMGASPGEEEAEKLGTHLRGRSIPQVVVSISAPLAIGRFEVTRGEFAHFVAETGHDAGSTCWTLENGKVEERSGRSWRAPGFWQSDRHPVVCVSWNDALAYMRWLSGKTMKIYRLLSESEWEYAARAGTTTRRAWGDSEEMGCTHANIADASARRILPGVTWGVACDDGHAYSSPVGSYHANSFGLHDMLGNVWEWTADCWNASHAGALSDGRARQSGDCSNPVLRGGGWLDIARNSRSAFRTKSALGNRFVERGFRVARAL
jgi:formylglycine-generating enzyme required for sulfatase activity